MLYKSFFISFLFFLGGISGGTTVGGLGWPVLASLSLLGGFRQLGALVPSGSTPCPSLSCALTLVVRNLEGSAGLDGIPRLQPCAILAPSDPPVLGVLQSDPFVVLFANQKLALLVPHVSSISV